MHFTQLRIETRRETPARARTDGESFLIRAGYLESSQQLTHLGELAAARLQTTLSADPARWSLLGVPLTTSSGDIVMQMPSGDFAILRCAQCGYADALETARSQKPAPPPEALASMERVATPDCGTIDALAGFLGIPVERTAKALLYVRKGTDNPVFVVVRGDMQASETKLRGAVGDLTAASHEQIVAAGAVPGYASPIGVRGAQILVDDLVPMSPNLAAGANEHGFHLLNTNYGRDYRADVVADVTLARVGDACPECGAPLQDAKGYRVVDSSGVRGVTALVYIAEQRHDDRGPQFPFGMGAFDVYLMHLPSSTGQTAQIAAELHAVLERAGIPVLYDDRDARAGVKFNDADLLGCPVRITIGEKHLNDRMAELKTRSSSTTEIISLDHVTDRVQALSKMPA